MSSFISTGPVTVLATQPTKQLLGDSKFPDLAEYDLPALPPSFPPAMVGELAWSGEDFVSESAFVYELTAADKDEITAGLAHFRGLELDGGDLTPADFPLPALGNKLRGLSHDVYAGKGFCVVRGINPKDYDVEDLTLVYLGIQSYIANQRGRQDKRGNMLVHIVADNSTKERDEHHRHSNKSIAFHNEETGDILSWLTRSTAAAGGKCIIASCYTVYNLLAANRPDLVRVLARSDWPFALPQFKCRPVIFYEGSKLVMNFGRTALLGSATYPRAARLPTLTSAQVEALDAIEAIAQATQLEFQTQAGDMHFINNLAVLHRRDGFADGELAAEKRHLVRMRLRDSERGWTIPDALKHEWDEAFNEEHADRVWHLEPMPDAFFPLRKYPN